MLGIGLYKTIIFPVVGKQYLHENLHSNSTQWFKTPYIGATQVLLRWSYPNTSPAYFSQTFQFAMTRHLITLLYQNEGNVTMTAEI